MSGMLPGLNLANVVAQLMVSSYYNSNPIFFSGRRVSRPMTFNDFMARPTPQPR